VQLDFAGQLILITGGAGDIGRAAAEGFLASGARKVVLLDAQPTALETAVKELNAAYPDRVSGEVADIADVSATRAVVRRALAGEPAVDVLCNIAGVNRRKPALEITETDWDYVLGVNLRGLFFITQEIGQRMVAQGRGAVVSMASVSSVRGHPRLAAYAASKGGVAQITRVLAHEWAAHGVRVNAVAPGYLETGLTRAYLSDAAAREYITSKIPLGRIGSAKDVVGAILFLASSLAAYITGEILFVDGGRTVD
jgi:NAD(P)-dependent dehydrogenase (short-subunit alcohol dehydrogenase family)